MNFHLIKQLTNLGEIKTTVSHFYIQNMKNYFVYHS